MASWQIEPVAIPSLGTPGSEWIYRALVEIENEDAIDRFGWTDLALVAGEISILAGNTAYRRRTFFLAFHPTKMADDGKRLVLGWARVNFPLQSNEHQAQISITVRPSARGQGLGTALLATAMNFAHQHNRHTLISFTPHGSEPPTGASALESPTGSGRVPVKDPGTKLALSHGFQLEQVIRHSLISVPLPAKTLEEIGSKPQARAGSDYRMLTWVNDIPVEHRAAWARLFTAISIDIPHGELKIEEDAWDADRVADFVVGQAAAGRGFLASAVEHIPSGELAGLTMFDYELRNEAVVFQDETIVLRAHRGHRLGLWLKATNLQALPLHRPGACRVHTFNAQENEHMLAINDAFGFQVRSVEGNWQRVG